MATLIEAQQFVQERLKKGVACPCCGQFAKLYQRKLNSTMARALIVLVRYFGTEYTHIERSFKDIKDAPVNLGGDFAKLRYWGLVEAHPGESGVWRLTQLGHSFVMGTITLPRHVFIFNDKSYGFGTEQTTIFDSLSDSFDYAELMKAGDL